MGGINNAGPTSAPQSPLIIGRRWIDGWVSPTCLMALALHRIVPGSTYQLAAVQIDWHHAHAETDLPTGKLHMDDDHHPWQKEERS